ncbi:MAG: hypothetical protein ACOVPA_10370 [Rubrivivax sp.]
MKQRGTRRRKQPKNKAPTYNKHQGHKTQRLGEGARGDKGLAERKDAHVAVEVGHHRQADQAKYLGPRISQQPQQPSCRSQQADVPHKEDQKLKPLQTERGVEYRAQARKDGKLIL